MTDEMKIPVKKKGKKASKSKPKPIKTFTLPEIKTQNLDLTIKYKDKIMVLDPDKTYVQVLINSVDNVSVTMEHFCSQGYEQYEFAVCPNGKLWMYLKKIEEIEEIE